MMTTTTIKSTTGRTVTVEDYGCASGVIRVLADGSSIGADSFDVDPVNARKLAAALLDVASAVGARLAEAERRARENEMIPVPSEVLVRGLYGGMDAYLYRKPDGKIMAWTFPGERPKYSRKHRTADPDKVRDDISPCSPLAKEHNLTSRPDYLRAVAHLTENPTEMVRRGDYERGEGGAA